jgi:hypothetical protein
MSDLAETCPAFFDRERTIAVAELDPSAVEAMRHIESSWFSSLGFCTLHRGIASASLRLWPTAGGVPAYCYFCQQSMPLPHLMIFGPTAASPWQIEQLMQEQNAQIAVLSMMPPSAVSQWRQGWVAPSPTRRVMQVIDFPDTAEAYLQSLGVQTRKHLPYYLRRISRDVPGVEVFTTEGAAISLGSVEQLVSLNAARIVSKGDIHGGWPPALIQTRWRLAQQCGLVCGLRLDGRIIGGTLSFVHGQTAYLVLIGHDPECDRYNLGSLSLWISTRSMIERGLKHCNLLWGQSFYKRQFGAAEHEAFDLVVYRVGAAALRWRIWQTGQWIHRQAGRGQTLFRRWKKRLSH